MKNSRLLLIALCGLVSASCYAAPMSLTDVLNQMRKNEGTALNGKIEYFESNFLSKDWKASPDQKTLDEKTEARMTTLTFLGSSELRISNVANPMTHEPNKEYAAVMKSITPEKTIGGSFKTNKSNLTSRDTPVSANVAKGATDSLSPLCLGLVNSNHLANSDEISGGKFEVIGESKSPDFGQLVTLEGTDKLGQHVRMEVAVEKGALVVHKTYFLKDEGGDVQQDIVTTKVENKDGTFFPMSGDLKSTKAGNILIASSHYDVTNLKLGGIKPEDVGWVLAVNSDITDNETLKRYRIGPDGKPYLIKDGNGTPLNQERPYGIVAIIAVVLLVVLVALRARFKHRAATST